MRIYINGMGIRRIARVTGITHPTIINWIKHSGERLPDTYDPEQLPQVGELDELETFVIYKKNKVWLWTAVEHFRLGILVLVVGNHSADTFQPLWQAIVFASRNQVFQIYLVSRINRYILLLTDFCGLQKAH